MSYRCFRTQQKHHTMLDKWQMPPHSNSHNKAVWSLYNFLCWWQEGGGAVVVVVDVEFHPKIHFLAHKLNEPSGKNVYKTTPLLHFWFFSQWSTMCKNCSNRTVVIVNFGHIHMLRFVVLMISFDIHNFGHIHPYFGQVRRLMFVVVNFLSSSNVKVHRCEFFSVIF